MKNVPFRPAALLLAVLLLASCGLGSPATKEFTSVQRDYLMRLRWKDFSGAASYMTPEHREEFLARFQDSKDLHVTDVRLERMEFQSEGKAVHTVSQIEYYLLPSATVKTLRLDEQWEWQTGDRGLLGDWVLVSPFPPFP